MKRVLLALLILCVSLSTTAQTDHYRVFRSELYNYNSYSKEWNKVKEWNNVNEFTNTNFYVSMTRNVITVNAKLATTFKLYGPYKERVLEDNTYILRWKALELTDNKECSVDIVKYENVNYLVLSVFYWDDSPVTNMRYYLAID